MNYGHTAWTRGIYKQHGHATRIYNTEMQHGQTAGRYIMDHHRGQQEHVAGTSSVDIWHGHAGFHYKDTQHGNTALTWGYGTDI